MVTSADRPQGRGKKIQPLPVAIRATAHSIGLFQPDSLSDTVFQNSIRELRPDALVVIAFRILPRSLFTLPRLGAFNVHPSLLPRYRGPAPIRWTLLNGDTETGVTIIQLSEQIDGGGMLAQEKTAILDDENYGELHDRLAELGARMLVTTLDAFDQRVPPPLLLQDESAVTKAPKLKAEDFSIVWKNPADTILNQIRALSPAPGAVAKSGGLAWKVLRARPSLKFDKLPAGLLMVEDACLSVGTGTAAIQLDEVQAAGKRPMKTAEFLRGRPRLPQMFD